MHFDRRQEHHRRNLHPLHQKLCLEEIGNVVFRDARWCCRPQEPNELGPQLVVEPLGIAAVLVRDGEFQASLVQFGLCPQRSHAEPIL